MAKSIYDHEKQLKILKDFCYSMGITINTNIRNVMVIKSKNITYVNFLYDNNSLEELTSRKYIVTMTLQGLDS
jgi:hypothetical protein